MNEANKSTICYGWILQFRINMMFVKHVKPAVIQLNFKHSSPWVSHSDCERRNVVLRTSRQGELFHCASCGCWKANFVNRFWHVGLTWMFSSFTIACAFVYVREIHLQVTNLIVRTDKQVGWEQTKHREFEILLSQRCQRLPLRWNFFPDNNWIAGSYNSIYEILKSDKPNMSRGERKCQTKQANR